MQYVISQAGNRGGAVDRSFSGLPLQWNVQLGAGIAAQPVASYRFQQPVGWASGLQIQVFTVNQRALFSPAITQAYTAPSVFSQSSVWFSSDVSYPAWIFKVVGPTTTPISQWMSAVMAQHEESFMQGEGSPIYVPGNRPEFELKFDPIFQAAFDAERLSFQMPPGVVWYSSDAQPTSWTFEVVPAVFASLYPGIALPSQSFLVSAASGWTLPTDEPIFSWVTPFAYPSQQYAASEQMLRSFTLDPGAIWYEPNQPLPAWIYRLVVYSTDFYPVLAQLLASYRMADQADPIRLWYPDRPQDGWVKTAVPPVPIITDIWVPTFLPRRRF